MTQAEAEMHKSCLLNMSCNSEETAKQSDYLQQRLKVVDVANY